MAAGSSAFQFLTIAAAEDSLQRQWANPVRI
jgi:hypothetical protein